MNNLITIQFNVMSIAIPAIIFVVLGIVIGIGLAVASKFLVVKVDDRIEKVTEMLPGYNCGACGKAGCAAFAEALVKGEVASVSNCEIIRGEKKQALEDYLAVALKKD